MRYQNTCAVTRSRLAPVLIFLLFTLVSGITTADPSFSPDQGKMPVTIQFTLPGGERCDSVLWDFGDDTTSTEVNPSHTYKTMDFFYPQCKCTLPGATITYNFDKIVSSNADMPDPDSADLHYPVEIIPEFSSAALSPDEQVKQGDVLYALGQNSYAAESYKKATLVSPSDPALLGKYGDVLSSLSRWNEAAAAYNQSIVIKADPAVLNAYGATLIKMNKYDQAIDTFNRTLAIDAANPIAYTGIGKSLESQKKTEEASVAYGKSVGLDANQQSAWVGYGNVLNTLGKYAEAVSAYEKAIALGVTGADIYNKYGAVLRKLGRDGDANRAMSTARSFQGQLYSGSDDYVPRCSAGGVMG